MQKHIDNFKKSASKAWGKFASFDYRIIVAVTGLLIVLYFFGRKILELFKPADTSKAENAILSNKNGDYFVNKQIAPNGHFISGSGVITKYDVTQARRDAESLASLLNTSKTSSWYSFTLSFFGLGAVTRIKNICDRNYPASYRRYVREVYKDVYTNNRSLQGDVTSALTGFAGSNYWTSDLTAYFTN